ncbi:MAG: hypothetical protein M0D53_06535 [Flavobacterium sp. JAD_PAG50586_2]|nr:MAG: hypothetical protein M0D53_06535 [Flavobacterium sp. JAD_PAG50586_2]
MSTKQFFLLLLMPSAIILNAQQNKNLVIPNENLITENIPEITKELSNRVKKYTESRGASFVTAHPINEEIIISTRFGATTQFHKVSHPLGVRKQITFLTNL